MGSPWANRAYTGDATCCWLDDLVARGPFANAAVFGSDGERYEAAWPRAHGSQRLDVYGLSPRERWEEESAGKTRLRVSSLIAQRRFLRYGHCP